VPFANRYLPVNASYLVCTKKPSANVDEIDPKFAKRCAPKNAQMYKCTKFGLLFSKN